LNRFVATFSRSKEIEGGVDANLFFVFLNLSGHGKNCPAVCQVSAFTAKSNRNTLAHDIFL
jgi:hypothetical protein